MNIPFLRWIDRYGIGMIAGLLRILPRRKKPSAEIKKILIIKLWAVGDAVVSLPLITGLRKAYPQATIDVFCHRNNAFVYTQHVDAIHLFPGKELVKKCNYYELVFDTEPFLNVSALYAWYLGTFRIGFAHQWRSGLYNASVSFKHDQHMVQNYLDMLRTLGKKYDTKQLVPLFVDMKIKEKIQKKLPKGKIVGINPGISGSAKTRMWPMDRFAEVIKYLIKKGFTVIIIDGKDNRETSDRLLQYVGENRKKVIDFTGKTNWPETVALISLCDLFIGNDSGPMHVAAAEGVKTVGLFGPNLPSLWSPYGPGNKAVYKPIECGSAIVNDKGIFPDCQWKGTKKEHNCMEKITVKEVISAIDEALYR